MKQITASEFNDEVANADLPVVIDFYTDHCGPCRMMAPVLNELSAENATRFKIVKVDAADESQLASECMVSVVPTFVAVETRKQVATRLRGLSAPSTRSPAISSVLVADRPRASASKLARSGGSEKPAGDRSSRRRVDGALEVLTLECAGRRAKPGRSYASNTYPHY